MKPISEEHKKIVSDLLNYKRVCKADGEKLLCTKAIRERKQAKGDSWKGKWIFTVKEKDRQLEKGSFIVKAQYDPKSRRLYPGDSVNAKDLKPNQVVYVGFTALEEGPQGYDVITNDLNKRRDLSDIKVQGNSLSWELKSGKEKGLFGVPMIFKTKAAYNQSTDTLRGETDFGMNFSYYEAKNLKEEKTKYVKLGSYMWEASRISDYTFGEFTKQGVFNDELPMYFVGYDPSLIKY